MPSKSDNLNHDLHICTQKDPTGLEQLEVQMILLEQQWHHLLQYFCLTYFCHDIFKCHELSSSVLLKSKKRKEAIKREKLAAASSWASYTCVWWQAYITKPRVHVP